MAYFAGWVQTQKRLCIAMASSSEEKPSLNTAGDISWAQTTQLRKALWFGRSAARRIQSWWKGKTDMFTLIDSHGRRMNVHQKSVKHMFIFCSPLDITSHQVFEKNFCGQLQHPVSRYGQSVCVHRFGVDQWQANSSWLLDQPLWISHIQVSYASLVAGA
jgi:hypothetical protein